MNTRGLALVFLLASVETHGYSQAPSGLEPEVFLTSGFSHLFRRTSVSDNGVNVGAGFGVLHRSGFGAEFEFNRTFGLSPKPVQCGGVGRLVNGAFEPLPCVGFGRNGPDSYSLVSANALYHFSEAPVQPYVSGGVGATWSSGFSSVTVADETEAVITETAWEDTGFALNFGGGVRVSVSERVSLRPEFRLYDSTLQSRQNLSLSRFSIHLGYHW